MIPTFLFFFILVPPYASFLKSPVDWIEFSSQKREIFRKVKEIKGLCGGVLFGVRRTNNPAD
jgi:hypothetical protein